MGELLRLHRDLLDVREGAVDPIAIAADDEVEPLEQPGGVVEDVPERLAVSLDGVDRRIEELVGLREEQVEPRRVDALDLGALVERGLVGAAGVDREELFPEEPLRGHVEVRVGVDRRP